MPDLPTSDQSLSFGPCKDPFRIASFVLVVLGLFATLKFGLLPGLFGACAAFGITRALFRVGRVRNSGPTGRMAISIIVGAIPFLLVVALALAAAATVSHAQHEFTSLMDYLAKVVARWRELLPPVLASHLPHTNADVTPWVLSLAKSQAGAMAAAGKSGAAATLMALVGIVVGVLLANVTAPSSSGPLSRAIRHSAIRLQTVFAQVVVAQVWIAAVNTTLTAVLLYGIFPVFDISLPYSGMLVVLTFVLGLIPVVGNLMCNALLTLSGLSVSPAVGAASLGWLILIHKLEYVINAKVVGSRVQTAAWELLVALFVMEAIFGVAGLACAPLMYAWLKSELRDLEWA